MKLNTYLSLLASIGVATASRRSLSSSGADFSSQEYDYIVIGGGTAGLAVAARLSEDPNTKVGVVEAGQYLADDANIDTPGLAPQLAGNPKYDWMFKSIPQAHLNNRVLNCARGKVLGGTSAINMMVFDRASKPEYDALATLGNPGWDWNGFLPSMKAAERFTGVDPFRVNNSNAGTIPSSQGTNGVIAGSYNNWYSDLKTPFENTLAKLGVPVNSEPDSGNAFGTYNSATSVNRTTGKRSYAANTYYAYNANRLNLVVLTGAQVTRIGFKNSTSHTKRFKWPWAAAWPVPLIATDVSFVHNSATFNVKAKKEIILSAGAYQTPQILELSGIGNSTLLRKFGINPLIDLPGVGEILQDHPLVPIAYELKPGSSTQNFDMLTNNASFAAAAQTQYSSTHDGIISNGGGILSFIDFNRMATSEEIRNSIRQLDRESPWFTTAPLQMAQYRIQKEWLGQNVGQIEVILNPGYFAFGTPKANTSYISPVMALQHPFSRGNSHINSSDPLAAPQINPNYFAKSFDLEALVWAVKFNLKLSKTEPLASMIVARQDPSPDVLSDDQIREYIKSNVISIGHPIGTAAMAPMFLGGVVDPGLKVYGTTNLRIVDASVLAMHVSAHPSRTIYGLAERAVAMIKHPYF